MSVPKKLSWSIPVGPRRDREPVYDVCSTEQRKYVRNIVGQASFAYATYNPFAPETPFGDIMFTWRTKSGGVRSQSISAAGRVIATYNVPSSIPRIGTVFAE